MKTRAITFAITITVGALWLGSSCSKNPSEPQKSAVIDDSLYVSVGGDGNGSRSDPYGSIQQAIDSSSARDPHSPVLVSSGTYSERIDFKLGVHV